MFTEFRQIAKDEFAKRGMSYAQVADKLKLSEGSIKSFMCGMNESRRVAEKLADVLKIKLVYSNGTYQILDSSEEV